MRVSKEGVPFTRQTKSSQRKKRGKKKGANFSCSVSFCLVLHFLVGRMSKIPGHFVREGVSHSPVEDVHLIPILAGDLGAIGVGLDEEDPVSLHSQNSGTRKPAPHFAISRHLDGWHPREEMARRSDEQSALGILGPDLLSLETDKRRRKKGKNVNENLNH